jgi:hypothetical protein
MPPQSNADYDLQLSIAMRDLDTLQHQFTHDAAFIYCQKDAVEQENVIAPKRIFDDLVDRGIRW